MGIELCKRCGLLHYLPGACPTPHVVVSRSPTQRRATPKGEKSTAVPKMAVKVTTPERTLSDRRGSSKRELTAASPASRKAVAKNVGPSGQVAIVEPAVDTLKQAEAAAAHLAPSRRGRPKTITDMKAYKAEKARERRARKAKEKSP